MESEPTSPLGILIPVYNEGDSIGATLEAIAREVRTPHRIYLIFDFDGDNTIPAAREWLRERRNILFVKNDGQGVLQALRTGIRRAEEEYLLVTMGDLCDDYRVVDRMMRLLESGFDIACGSRYMKGGRQIGGPVLKRHLSRLAGLSLRYLAGFPTRDATNNFKMYRRALFERIRVESEGGFELGMEVVVKGFLHGCRIAEIPCIWRERKKGKSKFRLWQWAPHYLRWYLFALSRGWGNRGRHPGMGPGGESGGRSHGQGAADRAGEGAGRA